jgi:hypothetical protein
MLLPMLSSSIQLRLITMAGCLAMLPGYAAAQQPLQLNVPYSCQDGVTRIITRCEKNARAEVCFWREEQNGQLIGERYNVRAQMDGWLATCKPPQAAQPAQPATAPPAAQSAVPPPMPLGRPGQPVNPPYLAGMPSPDVVRQKIQGSSSVDTLARQVAVLNRLPQFMQRMRLAPERGFTSTPDEIQALNAYNMTSYQLSQAYIKSATPEAAKTFQQMVAKYESDAALYKQMMGLLSPATIADYERVDRQASQRADARAEQQRREAEQARAPQAAPTAGAPTLPNDPGRVEMRRCLELGGAEAECLGKGLQTGFIDFIGGAPAELLTLAAKSGNPPGVRIGGTFAGPAGLTITFDNGAATVFSCGKLEPEPRSYTVAKRGNQLQVEIANTPKPLVVVLGPNNVFTGPAAQPITGNVIVGYRTQVSEQRYVLDNTVVPGSRREIQVPIYETRTVNCGFASLRATQATQTETSLTGLFSQILGGQADPAAQRSGTMTAPAGPRMGGTYAGAGGLKVEFRATSAILDCGQAHVMTPYDVQNAVDRLVVTVRHGNVPMTLTMQPDGTLVGSGSIDVAGRLFTGMNDSNVTFAPHQERCAVGTLSVRSD